MRIGTRLLTNAILLATFSVGATALLIGVMSYNYGQNHTPRRSSRSPNVSARYESR